MILKAEKISKSYGNEKIFENITFSAESGDSIVITGDSGRGKSTLISVLGIILQPDAGDIFLDGKNITVLGDKEKSKIRNWNFGYMFQHKQLIGSANVLENVLVPTLIAGKKGMENHAEKLLAELGLSDRMYHYPHQLSIGQKRRVTLARALIMDPDIVFADEPTNDLDKENSEIVAEKLFGITERGKTLVLVTHDSKLTKKAGSSLRL